ncbi:hypothetical protein [Lachnobacterium bovis]|jgi:hypothetical protein|uniref:Uncharacterized protein n=1 Tax=Lachnobacterium bovis DSM 14045 TaxID=1122142 RepID=A0A1H3L463_9FIRM|nr:hypothetical protein [Lachnobacterium bovis]SDY58748.1 hypothetical protein SAMN02910414_01897 [Lachnobacterium bovis DSM 14045]
MKEIRNYDAFKYHDNPQYIKIEDGIYKKDDDYVTSLSFVQEPEFEEGINASDISQFPLEDILDRYFCFISDFYESINVESSTICYLEFAARELDDIRSLREIIGKHVYNKEVKHGEQTYVDLIIS